MTSFSFFKYFDAFELDVNVVNFVYYGKTRLSRLVNGLNGPFSRVGEEAIHHSQCTSGPYQTKNNLEVNIYRHQHRLSFIVQCFHFILRSFYFHWLLVFRRKYEKTYWKT